MTTIIAAWLVLACVVFVIIAAWWIFAAVVFIIGRREPPRETHAARRTMTL
jgi:hypothetical protein